MEIATIQIPCHSNHCDQIRWRCFWPNGFRNQLENSISGRTVHFWTVEIGFIHCFFFFFVSALFRCYFLVARTLNSHQLSIEIQTNIYNEPPTRFNRHHCFLHSLAKCLCHSSDCNCSPSIHRNAREIALAVLFTVVLTFWARIRTYLFVAAASLARRQRSVSLGMIHATLTIRVGIRSGVFAS